MTTLTGAVPAGVRHEVRAARVVRQREMMHFLRNRARLMVICLANPLTYAVDPLRRASPGLLQRSPARRPANTGGGPRPAVPGSNATPGTGEEPRPGESHKAPSGSRPVATAFLTQDRTYALRSARRSP